MISDIKQYIMSEVNEMDDQDRDSMERRAYIDGYVDALNNLFIELTYMESANEVSSIRHRN